MTERVRNQQGLPENLDYTDDGCDLAPRCLSCPLGICKYDAPWYLRLMAKYERDVAIVRTVQKGQLTQMEISRLYGISDRTVHRVMQQHREGKLQPPEAEPPVTQGAQFRLARPATLAIRRR